MKRNIAIVVQRYGLQINGGAEMHARMIAEKLQENDNVTILTSCAIDYHTWDPVLTDGVSYENNIKIIRFKNQKRYQLKQERYYHKVKKTPFVYFRYKLFKWFKYWIPYKKSTNFLDYNNISWLKFQGPEMPDLIDFLKLNNSNYDAFIFFTSLYYPTALGISEVASKSILVPTMHHETASFFPVYQKVMASARWIMYNTTSEKIFSEKIFPIKYTKNDIVAVGIDVPSNNKKDSSVLKKYNINKPYLIYVGRIDKSKGCDEMITYFKKFLKEKNDSLQLVLVGKSVLNIEKHQSIIEVGFVDDDEKILLMQHATCLVMPSKFESLSLVLLESFACKVPVIVNGKTEVLKNHIIQSNGGWNYTSYISFKRCLNELLKNKEESLKKGLNGFEYVKNNYTWETVIKKYYIAIDEIKNKKISFK